MYKKRGECNIGRSDQIREIYKKHTVQSFIHINFSEMIMNAKIFLSPKNNFRDKRTDLY